MQWSQFGSVSESVARRQFGSTRTVVAECSNKLDGQRVINGMSFSERASEPASGIG